MKILDKFWFNGGGIVRVMTHDHHIKYYIRGLMYMVDPDKDAEYIAQWGNTFPNDVGDVLFEVNK